MKVNKKKASHCYVEIRRFYVIHYDISNKKSVGNFVKTKKDLDSGPKVCRKFGKVAKRAADAKSLRTADLNPGFLEVHHLPTNSSDKSWSKEPSSCYDPLVSAVSSFIYTELHDSYTTEPVSYTNSLSRS